MSNREVSQRCIISDPGWYCSYMRYSTNSGNKVYRKLEMPSLAHIPDARWSFNAPYTDVLQRSHEQLQELLELVICSAPVIEACR